MHKNRAHFVTTCFIKHHTINRNLSAAICPELYGLHVSANMYLYTYNYYKLTPRNIIISISVLNKKDVNEHQRIPISGKMTKPDVPKMEHHKELISGERYFIETSFFAATTRHRLCSLFLATIGGPSQNPKNHSLSASVSPYNSPNP